MSDDFEGNTGYASKFELKNFAFDTYMPLISGNRNGRRYVIFQITEKYQPTDTVEMTYTCAIHDRFEDQEYQVIAFSEKSCPLIISPIFWGRSDQYCNTTEMFNLCNIFKGETVVVGDFAYQLLH